jgi:hypothetical protein
LASKSFEQLSAYQYWSTSDSNQGQLEELHGVRVTANFFTTAKEGEKMISPVYSRHAALLERIFEPLSESQRLSLEGMLKAVGKNAETMAEMPED